MTKKTVLGMPGYVFNIICSVLVIGIIIGDFYQHYGNIISHLLYPVAGMCLFKGLRKKGSSLHHLGIDFV